MFLTYFLQRKSTNMSTWHSLIIFLMTCGPSICLLTPLLLMSLLLCPLPTWIMRATCGKHCLTGIVFLFFFLFVFCYSFLFSLQNDPRSGKEHQLQPDFQTCLEKLWEFFLTQLPSLQELHNTNQPLLPLKIPSNFFHTTTTTSSSSSSSSPLSPSSSHLHPPPKSDLSASLPEIQKYLSSSLLIPGLDPKDLSLSSFFPPPFHSIYFFDLTFTNHTPFTTTTINTILSHSPEVLLLFFIPSGSHFAHLINRMKAISSVSFLFHKGFTWKPPKNAKLLYLHNEVLLVGFGHCLQFSGLFLFLFFCFQIFWSFFCFLLGQAVSADVLGCNNAVDLTGCPTSLPQTSHHLFFTLCALSSLHLDWALCVKTQTFFSGFSPSSLWGQPHLPLALVRFYSSSLPFHLHCFWTQTLCSIFHPTSWTSGSSSSCSFFLE